MAKFRKLEKLTNSIYHNAFWNCMPNYQNRNVTFIYIFPNQKDNIDIKSAKLNVIFISWKSLSEIFSNAGNKFDEQYSLFITEALPGNKYRSMQVELVNYKRDPIENFQRYE